MTDSCGRTINYMRISITDRCNLRCRYCMPKSVPWTSRENLLTAEQIEMICAEAAELGITRFKITGGEPLVRSDCCEIIQRIRKLPGTEQVTLTTNGVLLKKMLDGLKEAGLDAVNISLDTLNETRYRQITGSSGLPQVLQSLACAVECGLPVKINTVLLHGVNEEEWWEIAQLAKRFPIHVRFIEMMPIGFGKENTGVDNRTLFRLLQEKCGNSSSAGEGKDIICPDFQKYGNGPAVYYKIPGFSGRIGFISALHGKFCASCNRIRLGSDGEIKPCLCYSDTISLREAVQTGNRFEIRKCLQEAIMRKPHMHDFEDYANVTEKKLMSKIGG